MIMRGHEYRRLDGSHSLEVRHESITDFNEDKDILAFLISTRAGGLGLNLVGADTVIFVDRDWVRVTLRVYVLCFVVLNFKQLLHLPDRSKL